MKKVTLDYIVSKGRTPEKRCSFPRHVISGHCCGGTDENYENPDGIAVGPFDSPDKRLRNALCQRYRCASCSYIDMSLKTGARAQNPIRQM